MANINFPNDPQPNDIFTVGGKTYTYDGVKWVANTTITKTDVGLENVQNYGVATQAEAESGSLDNKYMTPLKTAKAISTLAPTTDNLSDIGDVIITNPQAGDTLQYDGEKWVNDYDPFSIFIDTSGSPGANYPINDANGNIMANLDKGIAYYGTVSPTDLFTSNQLSSEIGLTEGINAYTSEQWYKYYWNGGIHFWRIPIRASLSWVEIADVGAAYGTGTTTSRKGFSGTSVNQDAEVTKNGVTYIVRLMEGANADPALANAGNDPIGTTFYNSEFNLILMNLHAATNSGSYSSSPTDGVSYNNWTSTGNYTNDDFVGWATTINDFEWEITANLGKIKVQQELNSNDANKVLMRGYDNLSQATLDENKTRNFSSQDGFAPVLTVKDSSFTTYGKSGGFNQSEPDW